MTPLYRIVAWAKHFENNKSRIIKDLQWVPVPNKMDGDGYTQLVEHKNGAAHLGCWHVIVSVASKCHPRGTLVRDDGTPHTAESIARMSRIQTKVISESVGRLLEIGWLEVIDSVEHGTVVPDNGTKVPPTGQRMEWNGMEEKGMNLPSGERARAREGRPKGLDEVRAYWTAEGLKGEPAAFFDHFENTGWHKDWKAAARNWSRREGTFRGRGPKTGPEINADVLVGKGPPAMPEPGEQIELKNDDEVATARNGLKAGKSRAAVREEILEQRRKTGVG